jgi:chromosome segregation ATPase
LKAELRSLETRAQKGKIPRRQYKVQKVAIEIRIEGLTRTIEKAKAVFRGSSGTYPDLVKQLDQAEEDLALAEENLKTLETYQSRGEISLETYKKNIGTYQKARDRAESAINGILLRLREKIR